MLSRQKNNNSQSCYVRVDPDTHTTIKTAAAKAKVSMQEYVTSLVAGFSADRDQIQDFENQSPEQSYASRTIPANRSKLEDELDVIDRIAPDTARRLRELIAQTAKDLKRGETLLHAAEAAARSSQSVAAVVEGATPIHRGTDKTARK